MTTHNILSDPAVQHIIPGLICGILLGISHNISRRLLEAVAVLGALALLFFMVAGNGADLQQFDFSIVTNWLTRWKYEIGGLIVGSIIGYSIISRPNHGGK